MSPGRVVSGRLTRVRGKVRTYRGHRVFGARVTLAGRRAVTNRAGLTTFSFRAGAPGTRTVRVTAPGMRTATKTLRIAVR